jgi:predicted AlkP superfamily pyrophosphatase or phosphodiesterase
MRRFFPLGLCSCAPWRLEPSNEPHLSIASRRDLHTVDDGVLQHMGDEMLSADWTGLIIHFLGVDHVGHTFGPSSTAMAAKLAQMDSALSQLFSAAEDDTLILVMGDHGMTGDGNHGGATEEETGAALLLLSKRQSQKSSTTDGLLFDGHDQHAIAAARLPAELLDASQNPGRARRVAQVGPETVSFPRNCAVA